MIRLFNGKDFQTRSVIVQKIERLHALQFYKLPYAEFACDIILHLFIDLFISGYSKVVAPSAYGAYGGYGSYGSYGGYGHGV